MAIGGDEVAAVFGAKDRSEEGNGLLQHSLFSLVGKVSALLWGFLFCLRSNKKKNLSKKSTGY